MCPVDASRGAESSKYLSNMIEHDRTWSRAGANHSQRQNKTRSEHEAIIGPIVGTIVGTIQRQLKKSLTPHSLTLSSLSKARARARAHARSRLQDSVTKTA